MVEELVEIPQTEIDKTFAIADLEKGCQDGIYKEVTRSHAMQAKYQGVVISSAFLVW